MSYKPEGYTSVAPYLIVADAEATLAFLKAVFGCDPLRIHRRESGEVMHAEVCIDDTVVMLGQMPDGPAAHVHVYVKDVDAAFERACQARGTVVQPLERKDDGDRRGGVCDSNGTTWWLANASPPDVA